MHRRVERGERHERAGDVRGLGVVDVQDAVGARRPPRGGARHPRTSQSPARTAPGSMPRASATAAAAIALRTLCAPAQADLAAPSAAPRPTTAARTAARPRPPGRRRSTRAARSRRGPRSQALRRDRDVVVALPGEHLQLGRDVVVHVPWRSSVVGLEVQQHRRLGRERLGVLELERRRLADDDGRRGPGRPTSELTAVPTLPATATGHARLAVDVARPARPSSSCRSSR